MLFPLKLQYYKGRTRALGIAAANLPTAKPTLFTGADSSLELIEAISHVGTKKLLVVTDKVLLSLGVLDKIFARLEDLGLKYEVYDGILPDPTYDQIEKGVEIFKSKRCDAVLAIGGGSPIDASKAMCAMITNNKPIEKLAGLFRVFKAPTPFYAIPTTAGTGSEVTIASVVSDPVTHKKNFIIDPKLVPLMASLDGNLMLGLPPSVTAATGMDALTHAIEAFISVNSTPETRSYSIAACKLIMQNLRTAVNEGSNFEARQNMAMASYYAGLAFTVAGVGYVHAIAHNFGALYGTPHGLGNSIVLPHVLDFSLDSVVDDLAELAVVTGLKKGRENKQKLAQMFIAEVRQLQKDVGIPATLEALKESDIPAIAREALTEAHNNYAVPKYMDTQDCEALVGKMVS